MGSVRSLVVRLPLGAVVLCLALLAAPSAQGAYPRVILVSGPELEKPVALYKFRDIAALTTAIAESPAVPAEQVKGRPYFRLSSSGETRCGNHTFAKDDSTN